MLKQKMDEKTESRSIIQNEMQEIINKFGFWKYDKEGAQGIQGCAGYIQAPDRKLYVEVLFPKKYPEVPIVLRLPRIMKKHSMFRELPEIVKETASLHFNAVQVLEIIKAKIVSIPAEELKERLIDELEEELNLVRSVYNVKVVEGKKHHIRIFYQVENWVSFEIEINYRNYPEKPKIIFHRGLDKVVGSPETLQLMRNWDVHNPPHIVQVVQEIEQRFSHIYRIEDIQKRLIIKDLTLATQKNRILTQKISFSAIRGGIIGIYCLNPEIPFAIFNAFSGIGTKIEGDISIFGRPPSKGIEIEQLSFILPPDVAQLLDNLSIEAVLRKNAPIKRGAREIKNHIDTLLSIIGLSNRRKMKLKELAAGEKRRVFIAISAIKLPELIFIVEPEKDLNATDKKRIWDTIIGINDKFSCTFFVYSTSEEIKRCHNILVLSRDGRELGFGTLAQLIGELPLYKEVIVIQLNSPNPEHIKALGKIPDVTFMIEERPGEKYRLFTKVDPSKVIPLIFEQIGSNIYNISKESPSLVDFVPFKREQKQ